MTSRYNDRNLTPKQIRSKIGSLRDKIEWCKTEIEYLENLHLNHPSRIDLKDE
jgi:hypothetical protein